MKRIIKFRAWDKNEKKMYEVYRLSGLSNKYHNPLVYVNREKAEISLDGYELMQFTGLLDKNGKEIYEGDILNILGFKNSPVAFVVKFSPPSFYLERVKKSDDNRRDFHRNCEILGNVYENKDLLK